MDNDYAYAFWFAYLPIIVGIIGLAFGEGSGFMQGIKLFTGFLVIGSLILGCYLFIREQPKNWLLFLLIAFGLIVVIPAILFVVEMAYLADYVKVLIIIYGLGFIVGLFMLRSRWSEARVRWWPFIGAISSASIIAIIWINWLLTVQPV